MNNTRQTEHYTFQLSDKVTRMAVTFKNRFGITVSGDLYTKGFQIRCPITPIQS